MNPAPSPGDASTPALTRRRLIAYLHHELKTPLAAMLAQAQVALQHPRTPDSYRLTLQAVERNVRALSRQVECMMEVAEAESVAMAPRWQLEPLAPFLRACATGQAGLAEQAGVTIFVAETGEESVWIDPQYLGAIVMGLLAHLIQRCSTGGMVTLRATAINSGLRQISLQSNDAPAPGDFTRHAFDPWQVAGTTPGSRDTDAVRLGLALVAEYAVLLGCTIEVGSTAVGGANFLLNWQESSERDAHS